MDNISVEKYGIDFPYEVQVRTDIGGREEQQDNAYVYSDAVATFAIVCDGMGGTEHGALASKMTVESIRNLWKEFVIQHFQGNIVKFFLEAMTEVDNQVFHEFGKSRGGTTVVAVVIIREKLYWFSAGDSRLYILRNGELVQATRDHNYFLQLNEQFKNGEITQNQFQQEAARGEALISYIGVGGLSVYDLATVPLDLMEGDILLLTTDGLYKAIPKELIQHILMKEDSLSVKADNLMRQITVLKNSVALDNTTYALIKINKRGVPNE